jgi:hypothetical protein
MDSRIKPIEALLQSGHTVWSLGDLRILWGTENSASLKSQVQYYCRSGRMIRLRRGIYALNKDYHSYELAQKLVYPSYISLESALRHHGIIHQYSNVLTCIAQYSRTFLIDEHEYQYHKISTTLLSCPIGIQYSNAYAMALPERALCDALYLGFKPDVSAKENWDISLLKKLTQEFSFPRVTSGLQQRSLLPA